MKLFSFTFLLILSGSLFVHAQQKSITAGEAYDIAQKSRQDAEDLWYKKGASQADIDKGLAILQHTLVFLDSVPVKELADGDMYLKFRRNDVTLDMVRLYAMTGKKEPALSTLEEWSHLGNFSSSAHYLQTDSDFMAIRDDARFKDVVKKLSLQGDIWNNRAFKTPYKAGMSEDEKIAGLSLLWSQAKYNFVHFDHAGIDWNQVYIDYLPKVRATRTTAEYYHLLMRFYALLKDGHTNVYPPQALSAQFYSRPPFRTQLVEGKVLVSQVFNDSLYKTGIVPGLEVLKVDSTDVMAYAENNIKPYQSSSTTQDMEIRVFSYALLAGAADKPLHIAFRTKEGKIFSRTIARSGYHNVTSLPSLTFSVKDDIGVLTINNFTDQTINKKVDSLFTAISETKGLIIDFRYNGGGDDGIVFHILRKLTDKPFWYSASANVYHTSRPGDEGQWAYNQPGTAKPDGKQYYGKPVALLVGPRTFSAGEDFTADFAYMKRGKLIGLPTGGSTGQPVSFDLPGGGSARVCGKDDTFPDGKPFIGIGIQPDIIVAQTIKDMQDGRDATLEKATAVLKQEIK